MSTTLYFYIDSYSRGPLWVKDAGLSDYLLKEEGYLTEPERAELLRWFEDAKDEKYKQHNSSPEEHARSLAAMLQKLFPKFPPELYDLQIKLPEDYRAALDLRTPFTTADKWVELYFRGDN